jgi:hypothetical protein
VGQRRPGPNAHRPTLPVVGCWPDSCDIMSPRSDETVAGGNPERQRSFFTALIQPFRASALERFGASGFPARHKLVPRALGGLTGQAVPATLHHQKESWGQTGGTHDNGLAHSTCHLDGRDVGLRSCPGQSGQPTDADLPGRRGNTISARWSWGRCGRCRGGRISLCFGREETMTLPI